MSASTPTASCTNRLSPTISARRGQGSAPLPQSARYIWPTELDVMGALAGFTLEGRHADWAGTEFTAESRSHVSIYRLTVAERSVFGCSSWPARGQENPVGGSFDT